MADPTVTVNVYDDTPSGHVSITVTDSSGVQHSYERQLNTSLTLGIATSVGVLEAAVTTMSSLGPVDSINQKVADKNRVPVASVTLSISEEQAKRMIDYAESTLGAVDYSLIGASCFNYATEILAAAGITTSDWVEKIDPQGIDAPISRVIEWAQEALAAAKYQPWNDYKNTQSPYEGLQDSGIGGLNPASYIGDKYYKSEIVREYVNEYIEGDLAAAAKVLVSGDNGDIISGDTGFWPDRIIRQQAGFEGGISGGVSTSGPVMNSAPTGGGGEGHSQQTSGGGSSGPTNASSGGTTTNQAGNNYNGSTRTDSAGRTPDDPKFTGPQPILLDLDGNGVKITEFDKSSQFVAGKDGLQHRTSWAGAGDGVLFFDPDGRNAITEERQYVFTEWNPTAAGDMEAIRSVWDTNGDGKLTSADAEFAKFKVMVTNADGSTTVKTLTELGITEIDLTANATRVELPDGSMITGQTTFTRANGTTGTVANTTLVSDAAGYRVEETVGTDGVNRVVTQTAYAADGGMRLAA